jgi:hypothetical protein
MGNGSWREEVTVPRFNNYKPANEGRNKRRVGGGAKGKPEAGEKTGVWVC